MNLCTKCLNIKPVTESFTHWCNLCGEEGVCHKVPGYKARSAVKEELRKYLEKEFDSN